jgi:hypothetical protein
MALKIAREQIEINDNHALFVSSSFVYMLGLYDFRVLTILACKTMQGIISLAMPRSFTPTTNPRPGSS